MNENILEEVEKIHPALASWDVLALLIAIILIMWYAAMWGKEYVVTLIQTLYLALVPFLMFDVNRLLPETDVAVGTVRLVVFGIFFLLIYFIVRKNRFFESPTVPSMWEIGAFGLVFCGFLFTSLGYIAGPEVTGGLSQIVQVAFLGDEVRLGWSLAPLVLFLMIRGT
ncbi:MAG: hypothetical protein O3B64_04050 [bacterium]|nr:hypothetical protein [bacterium]